MAPSLAERMTNGDPVTALFVAEVKSALHWVPKTEDDHAVLAIRNLTLDITMQNGGGHGGSAVGMAAIGVALWKYTMRFNPNNADWFDRDRFVLSNGHASMFLYTMNHLVGYEAWTMDELKAYGSSKLKGFTTLSHAHPEVDCPAVEVTTGPLGQGIANAVGLALASKNLAARFNEPSFDVIRSRIYCMTGDGCLMEGVALEAITLAGHFHLDNLVLLYDNNQVTCDGPLDWINTEDVNAKMRACGWDVLDVMDGRYDAAAVVQALETAHTTQKTQHKPVMINIRTVIGIDTAMAGTAKAHHGAFDIQSIQHSKFLAGLPPTATHVVPEKTLQFFRERKPHGATIEKEWKELVAKYTEAHPAKAAAFAACRTGSLGNLENILASLNSKQFEGNPTRKTNGIILQKLWKEVTAICGGGADLVNSNNLRYADSDVFGSDNYAGRYIRYGIREHAMASISNGLAAYNPGTFLPITATFFMFYIYAAPGVRMGALNHLQTIHIATHDSFAEGQNGPTHQPVELESLYRAMPNLNYIRPCDAEELIGAWSYALSTRHTPSMLSIARDPVGPVPCTSRVKVALGAYVIDDAPATKTALTLASCGSNLHHAVAAAALIARRDGLKVRLVSAPSLDLFQKQSQEYKDSVFPRDGKPIVSVEEYVPTVWARYVTASCGMNTFGYSASNESNYERFGLDGEGIRRKVLAYLEELNGEDARRFGWREL